MDFITGVIFTHRVSEKLRCLEALVTGYFTVLRAFIEGKRGSLTRPLHHIHHPIGCSETSTLLTAFLICGRCLHLISTQNAPFSTNLLPLPIGGRERSIQIRSINGIDPHNFRELQRMKIHNIRSNEGRHALLRVYWFAARWINQKLAHH